MEILGLDIGGSGIKGAIVDTENGKMITDRYRIDTPEGAEPEDVAKTVKRIINYFDYKGPVGVGFPSIVQHGIILSAANVSKNWIGKNINDLLNKEIGNKVHTLNDADAAGIAEMRHGIGKEYEKGVVILLTIGTGIGSAIFTDGVLLPNTEFGHLSIRGKDAEHRASDAVRQIENLSWKKWGMRFDEFLVILEKLFSPDLFILGGGISKKFEKYAVQFTVRTRVMPALLLNQAGIIGAAMYANEQTKRSG
ncbi:MAG TPA: ROK family protein [Anaerolineaceae bacterium]|nr:ROK family protein [Anaerolineaceae bacterium]